MKEQETWSSHHEVALEVERGLLKGFLHVPERAQGVVLFAHGSGSGRFSPRNRSVAEVLQRSGLATLLMDLLDEDEADDRRKTFDVGLLADRLMAATDWLGQHAETQSLGYGCFGASTGAGAALAAAAQQPHIIKAVVSRGGRPDLALEYLERVPAPTLLIVGGSDDVVLDLNRQALAKLRCPKELVVIPGATHLFPEPGALEDVARHAQDWFARYLPQ